ncbi:MAG: MATE family efflux transporter, partial [Bacteroidetes bacterium]
TSAILRGLGDSKTPLYFMVVSTITNIILDYVFVAYFHWGIAGVAYATIISQGGAFITAILYLNKYHHVVKLSLLRITFDRKIFKQSLRIGLPSGFQQSIVAIGLLALVWIVNLFGTDVIAAYSIAMRIDSLAAMAAMNFAAALATFVGQNMGANKPERVKAGLIATLKMTSVIAISISLVAIFFSTNLMALFTKDENVIRIGAEYLVIVGGFYILFSVLFAYNGVMRGAGDTLVPMFITLIALWIIRIPAAYFLSQHFGEVGIWWATPIGWFIGMVLSYLYYMTGRWKKKGVVKYDDQGDVVS